MGVALPGPLDHRGGVLHRVTGFPQWDGYPLRDALAEHAGLPVVVDKDTNAAALGLALRERADADFAYLHLGTGLGAGLVLGGAVHRGARTGAGEFGHQTLQLDGPRAAAAGAAASRRSAWPPTPAATSPRRPGSSERAPRTSSGSSTSTGSSSADVRSPPTRTPI